MNELKEYKEVSIVYFIDWNWDAQSYVVCSEEELKEIIEDYNENAMVKLWWRYINKFNIKEIKRSDCLSEAEKFFYNLPKEVKEKVANRIKWGRFDNVDSYISSLKTEQQINDLKWFAIWWLKDFKYIE